MNQELETLRAHNTALLEALKQMDALLEELTLDGVFERTTVHPDKINAACDAVAAAVAQAEGTQP